MLEIEIQHMLAERLRLIEARTSRLEDRMSKLEDWQAWLVSMARKGGHVYEVEDIATTAPAPILALPWLLAAAQGFLAHPTRHLVDADRKLDRPNARHTIASPRAGVAVIVLRAGMVALHLRHGRYRQT